MNKIIIYIVTIISVCMLNNLPVGADDENIIIGKQADNYNTLIGYYAGRSMDSSGKKNTFVGAFAGQSNNSGSYNTYLGARAGEDSYTSSQNTAVGFRAAQNINNSSNNTYIGYAAGRYTDTTDYNTAVGANAGYHNSSINNSSTGRNVYIGHDAGYNNNGGSRNTFIGKKAGHNNREGKNNTIIGYGAGYDMDTYSNNIFIGYYAVSRAGSSHMLYISNSNNNPLIVGNFSQKRVGIGTAVPMGTLDVNGTIYQRGRRLHADYVFDPSVYRLESIEEHARHMWSNKHLKAIPKARVDENGRDVIYVEKHRRGTVEELEKAHIYIDQLHNNIKTRNIKIKNLNAQLNTLEVLLKNHTIRQ